MRDGTDDLNRLAGEFDAAALATPGRVRAVVQKGAQNVKTEAQQFASGLAHAPQYPRSITYDTQYTAAGASAEVGPDKDRPQGALGNILEYGTSKNAPIAHLGPALDREAPNFLRALGEVSADILGG